VFEKASRAVLAGTAGVCYYTSAQFPLYPGATDAPKENQQEHQFR
jgi:hypothetical protein